MQAGRRVKEARAARRHRLRGVQVQVVQHRDGNDVPGGVPGRMQRLLVELQRRDFHFRLLLAPPRQAQLGASLGRGAGGLDAHVATTVRVEYVEGVLV